MEVGAARSSLKVAVLKRTQGAVAVVEGLDAEVVIGVMMLVAEDGVVKVMAVVGVAVAMGGDWAPRSW